MTSLRFGVFLAACLAPPLTACGGAVKPAESPCQNRPVTVALGFDHAQVGRNELPIAILCNPTSLAPAPRVTEVTASFVTAEASTGQPATTGEVVYRPSARVLSSPKDRLQFDYLVRVMLDRAGSWILRLDIRAPWNQEEAHTEVTFRVAMPSGSAPAARDVPPGQSGVTTALDQPTP